jgi:hypothetical protein
VRPLRTGLDRILRSLDPDHEVHTALHRNWRDVAGPELADHVELGSFDDGVMRLVADHGTWAARARYAGPAILDRANGMLGREAVRGIVVAVRPPRG